MSVPEQFDVIVVGGGPAGSTAATLIADQGHRVVLVDKQSFPRYQIGESLLPATVHGVCRLLGVEDEVRAAGFTVKRGGSFRWGTSPEPWNFLFALSPELSGPTSYAYQVDRMTFDHLLLKNAARHGVDVREESPALAAVTDGERVSGIRYTDPGGRERELAARWVVDASGNGSRLHAAAGGRRQYSEFFQNLAVFGYFEGGGRLPAPDSGNILCAAFDEGWLWYIPLSDTLTSVGAVLNRGQAARISADRERTLMESIQRCAIVRDMLGGAVRVTEGTYGEIRVRKDYSYADTRFWAPGIALAGDAACFIDPVFSTGVHLATYGGLLAARSVNSVLAGELPEERAFGEFEARYRREYAVFYEFLAAFYDMQQHEDSYFWKARKVTNMRAGDMEAFTTLVAGAYSAEAALVRPDTLAERFSASSADLAGAVERTGAARTPSGERMTELFRAPVVADVMTEMNQIQRRGVGGAITEPPLIEGGLVPSPDGRRWIEPDTAPAAGTA
ncbi:tryptophan 7-halogenase [Streptomonospora nanhaiensis]|uniref:tryptophan 7-halogenase n=1 Tax=Streptomonospora nanhaiensis TaxID=1323731 RepID=UPI001C3894E1|nr:tryptophan 7-halogenase [Streptomonospora nanhaiensis]MBV2363773.1 tryptophan 7-halogenase [Streptomonospora nanhaiensis]MBX9388538.1 tryptophan 7-halogenase [Streptomonospora nanhaiensis]